MVFGCFFGLIVFFLIKAGKFYGIVRDFGGQKGIGQLSLVLLIILRFGGLDTLRGGNDEFLSLISSFIDMGTLFLVEPHLRWLGL